MRFRARKKPFTSTLMIYILLDFRGFYHPHIILKRIPLFSSWNSANFNRWTVSVGQVDPKVPPPHIATQISQQIYTDLKDYQKFAKKRGIPRIRGGFHCLIKALHQLFMTSSEPPGRARDVITQVTSRVTSLWRRADRHWSPEYAKFWILKIGP